MPLACAFRYWKSSVPTLCTCVTGAVHDLSVVKASLDPGGSSAAGVGARAPCMAEVMVHARHGPCTTSCARVHTRAHTSTHLVTLAESALAVEERLLLTAAGAHTLHRGRGRVCGDGGSSPALLRIYCRLLLLHAHACPAAQAALQRGCASPSAWRSGCCCAQVSVLLGSCTTYLAMQQFAWVSRTRAWGALPV